MVVPSASGNDGAGIGGPNAGHCRVYRLDVHNAWVQLGGDIDGERESDTSGVAVSLSADGHTVAIGASANSGAALEGRIALVREKQTDDDASPHSEDTLVDFQQ